MPRQKKLPSSNKTSRDRVVYEVQTPHQGVRRIEAESTQELREALAPLLPEVELYAVQAIARLASQERATISTGQWGIRRIGVMTFQADDAETNTEPVSRSRGRGPRVQSQLEQSEATAPVAASVTSPLLARATELGRQEGKDDAGVTAGSELQPLTF